MRKITCITALLALGLGAAFAQEKKEKTLALKDLAPAVQKTIQAELKGGEIKSIGKETEHGVAQYEVETMLNGKHRDFNVDTKGTLLLVEEETSIESIPAAAKAAILKKVGDGKLGMVELFMRAARRCMKLRTPPKPARSTRSSSRRTAPKPRTNDDDCAVRRSRCSRVLRRTDADMAPGGPGEHTGPSDRSCRREHSRRGGERE